MERRTKQLVAVVAIVVIATASGVGIWLFLSLRGPTWLLPGAPSGIPEDQWIKVGCLGDLNDIQGIGNYEGAHFAAYEINSNGGVEVNGTTYYVAVAKEDTAESRPVYDATIGVAAAERMLEVHGAEYIVGGFRTEVLEAYIETVMDAETLFFGTGAATDDFCENVADDYGRYKYFFRFMPINSTALGTQIISFVLGLIMWLNSTHTEDLKNAVILREDLSWTAGMGPLIQYALTHNAAYNFTNVLDKPYPADSTADDFDQYWQEIETYQTDGAHLVVPIISAGTGVFMMDKYHSRQPDCVIVGINVESQLDEYWTNTAGDARYETMMQPLVRTNKTEKTIEYYDAYKNYTGHSPLYTASGAYDSVKMLVHAINETQGFNNTEIIEFLEDTTFDNFSPFVRKLKWNQNHDLVAWMGAGDDLELAQTLMAQWQEGGEKVAVDSWPAGWGPYGGFNPFSFYPTDMELEPYSLPNWVNTSWGPI